MDCTLICAEATSLAAQEVLVREYTWDSMEDARVIFDGIIAHSWTIPICAK